MTAADIAYRKALGLGVSDPLPRAIGIVQHQRSGPQWNKRVTSLLSENKEA